MVNNVEISNELIARYVDNQVNDYEREVVQQYFSENPDELESVLVMTTAMLLNEDDDFLPEDHFVGCNTLDIDSEIIYSAAAFAPQKFNKNVDSISHKKQSKKSIFERLADMLLEIEKQ